MYDNIGGKIKSLAVWTFIGEAIGSIIAGFILMAEVDVLYILLVIFGPLVAWVSSWILYAFGEMVEDIHAMRNKITPASVQDAIDEANRQKANDAAIKKAKQQQRKSDEKAKQEKAQLDEEEQFIEESYIDIACPSCGEQLSFLKDETNGFCPECGANFKIK